MSDIWLTSDTHYGHTNIIKYCSRPFSTSQEMDEALSDRHNKLIKHSDTVIHVGDVTLVSDPFKDNDPERARIVRTIKHLNGKKILIKGNHDKPKMVSALLSWKWCVVSEIFTSDTLLRHYHHNPHDTRQFSLTIHGHSHNSFKAPGFIDVGVDAQPDYSPVLLEEIVCDKDELDRVIVKVRELT